MYVCTDILFEAARYTCHKDKRAGKNRTEITQTQDAQIVN